MFEARLKIVVGVFALALLVIVVRLIDLQVVRAGQFKKQAEQALLYAPQTLPFARGRILDRMGVELAADRPCWEVAVDFDILAAVDSGGLEKRIRRLADDTPGDPLTLGEANRLLHQQLERMWNDLARLSGESVVELHERARRICRRIRRLRELLERHHGYEFPIAEERTAHAIVDGLDGQQQIAARRILQDLPWVEVRAATTRVYARDPSLAHILGQMGAVTVDTLKNDPSKDDPHSRYLATERVGVSGVELAAEQRLRGRRGELRRGRDGRTVENLSAENGADVELTIRTDLQSSLYRLLEQMLPATPHPTGGAIVVLEVPTREVLAMVSYPGYDNNTFRKRYNDLSTDLPRQPLRFRSVANAYAPGSIIKPLTCIAGLSTGEITPDTVFDCRGYYYPETQSGKRCWRLHGTDRRATHGPVRVADAIAHSCNIFMYHTGERLGVNGLCNFFEMAGVGKRSGLGLREEISGINPTPSYLASRGRAVAKGDAWNYAIGQGEVAMTPVQTANLMATYASGINREVTLIFAHAPAPEWRLPVQPEHWDIVRRGMFRVTNEPGATAYRTARFVRDGYALCGKTGSASTFPWVIAYEVFYIDDAGERRSVIVPANGKREANDRFAADRAYRGFELIREDTERFAHWPPLDDGRRRPTRADQLEHAWFVAYLQAVDHDGQPLLEVTPRIAFSVLVEFGGSGGRVAGPIAARVAETILDTLGPSLDPDGYRRATE
ncbi:MAG: hypothetical protein GY842_04010 [bacterium]|nr:hypothetical protein [bacterium]